MGDGEVIEGVLSGCERLDKALAQASGLSRERVKALIGEGRVTVGGSVVKSAAGKAVAGAAFAIEVPPPQPLTARAQDIPLDVVFEDDEMIVIDKPRGREGPDWWAITIRTRPAPPNPRPPIARRPRMTGACGQSPQKAR